MCVRQHWGGRAHASPRRDHAVVFRVNRLLTIDCGNTTIDAYLHVDGVRRRFDSRGSDVEDLRRMLASCGATRCVVASVSDVGFSNLQRARPSGFVTFERAGVDLPPPLPIDYDPPGALGVDRWVGAFAAYRIHGSCLVVDCGSATTFNLVDHGGIFRGGAIAPGLRAFVEGMQLATPALPLARLDTALELPARATRAAVDAGVQLGYCGAVDAIAQALAQSLDRPLRMVVTGGNAARLLRHSRLAFLHEPALVHQGLALLVDARPCGS